jgi:4-methyl-5(b-hydroxyethyl)-thiazole monophosphate biosynthesis
MAKKSVLVPIAHGTEELEAVCVIDVLRRAGANVCVASVDKTDKVVTCSRGVLLGADTLVKDLPAGSRFDLIVCPGGMPGATNLAESPELQALLKDHSAADQQGLIGAICASPAVVLAPLGLLSDVKATGYPAEKFIKAIPTYVKGEPVVDSGKIITSQGPATALAFSLHLVGKLYGTEMEKKIRQEMLA